ncbi:Hypothetical predicted protein [Pelobates cultripes]|uniref:Sperm-associated antigen 17 n=1 Tax=Pelobates cultripes TaxID=61616 RepID=A0AAD1VHV3_PELCU|nr:Hypothetical predicted protein [Pelobates cultripes]
MASSHSCLRAKKVETKLTAHSENSQKLLIRQSYPVRVRKSQMYKGTRNQAVREASRVVTASGIVVKYMLDGSTQVLFPDGTVCQSPDSGPIVQPSGPSSLPPKVRDAHPATPPSARQDDQKPEPVPEQVTKKGKSGHKTMTTSARQESVEAPGQEPPAPVITVPEIKPGTWITTTPSGQKIGTRGSEKLELSPVLYFKSTDPVNGTVMTTREDQVVTVQENDGTFIVEHADGTRITTFYQDVEIPLSGDHEETGEIPQTILKRTKFVRVESEDFATIILNCESNVCYAVFGDGTEICAKPQGTYQVYPSMSGCLSINQDGRALYSPRTSSSTQNHSQQEDPIPASSTSHTQDPIPASYTMSHTQDVICEALDPEGNHYQVMANGSTSVVLCSTETGEGEDELEKSALTSFPKQSEVHKVEVYDLHAPRFFIVHPDGSGTELLRKREVEDYLASCYSDSKTAVIEEPAQERPGVQSITVLKPFPDTSQWILKKQLANLSPTNLISRTWEDFPASERKTPGPPLGIGSYEGLCFSSSKVVTPPPPVQKCPKALQIRQLLLYQSISKSLRERLQLSLKGYVDKILKKEEYLKEINIKDPRTEDEREHAADLLKLVLSFTDFEESSQVFSLEHIEDIACLYQKAISPDSPPPPPVAKSQRSVEDWEKQRQEILGHKESLMALRNRDIPPYFQSELGVAFLQTQVPDTEHLSKQLPPFIREKKKTEEPLAEPDKNPGAGSEGDNDSRQTESRDTVTPHRMADCGIDMAPDNKITLYPVQDEAETEVSWPAMIPPKYYQPLARSLNIDVTGQPRREKVRLPKSILISKPASVPNRKFVAAEDPVRCNTNMSMSPPRSRGTKRIPRGFHLFPSAVQFGIVREGYTYSMSVTLKNIGVEFCRFLVKPPPPSSGLRVSYTPGPVAAGMETRLDIELFAMAVGLEGPEGEAEWSHCIEVQTEVETLFLPVTANILPLEQPLKQQARSSLKLPVHSQCRDSRKGCVSSNSQHCA